MKRVLAILRLKGLHSAFPSPQITQLVLHSVLVGIVAGLGTLVFSHALDFTSRLCIKDTCGVVLPVEGSRSASASSATEVGNAGVYQYVHPPMRKRIWILVVPALGGLLCGLLVYRFAPETEGHGTDAVVDAFHRKDGFIRRRVPLVKMVSSILTLSTGGNAGREGPVAQISAGFGSFLADLLKLTPRRRRILVLAGVGAGVGSMFRSPLGGALFAVEVLYRETEFEYEALIPAFIASIVGYTTYASLTDSGMGSIFTIPYGTVMTDPRHLLLSLLLVPFLVGAGLAYIKGFYGITAYFKNEVPVSPAIKPMLGGLALGIIGFADPRLLTTGYGWVQQAIENHLAVSLMLWLAAAKIVLTGVTIGSGGSGGIFGPSMVIGGLLGGAFGTFFHQWFPDVQPASFVLLGMAGFFSSVAKTPISTIIMVSEMTVGYALLLPLMLVSSMSYLLMPERVSIYCKQVARRKDSPAHLGDFVVDLLDRIPVSKAMTRLLNQPGLVCFDEREALSTMFNKVAVSAQTTFPIVDAQHVVTGIVRLDDLRAAFMQPDLGNLIISRDVATTDFNPLTPEDSLKHALQQMARSQCGELPVVDSSSSRRIIGLVNRHEIMQTYGAEMEKNLAKS